MAKKLGYGGLAATNGARDFSGKTVVAGDPAQPTAPQIVNNQ